MEGIDLDPSRVAAQVVSGIGLLERVLLFSETNRARAYYRCRNLGYFGHRSGYWSRYVLAGNLSNNPYADWS